MAEAHFVVTVQCVRLLAVALVLAGCAPDTPAPPERAEAPPAAGADSGRVVSLVPPVDERALRIRVRAPSDQTLYLDNCGGAFGWGLEHQVEAPGSPPGWR